MLSAVIICVIILGSVVLGAGILYNLYCINSLRTRLPLFFKESNWCIKTYAMDSLNQKEFKVEIEFIPTKTTYITFFQQTHCVSVSNQTTDIFKNYLTEYEQVLCKQFLQKLVTKLHNNFKNENHPLNKYVV